MNRRAFLQSAAAGLFASTALGAKGACRAPAGPLASNSESIFPIIDAHCHIFNASDLAIEGFIKHSVLHASGDHPLDAAIAAFDYQLQSAAPSFEEENALLDAVLRGDPIPEEFDRTGPSLDDFDNFLDHLAKSRPELLRGGEKQEIPLFGEGILFNALRWAWILTRHRLHIMQLMFNTFSEVELFVPAIVDMDLWLSDHAETSVPNQIRLYEKLVRISQGRIMPLAPFDPWRQVEAERAGTDTPLEWLQDAVLHRGFAGVKLYPTMGFRAEGNAELRPRWFYRPLDSALEELYEWCQQERVPVLAHANASWGSQRGFEERAGPEYWRRALERFPDLRISFGHFGGDNDLLSRGMESRCWDFANLMQEYPNAFADIGFHDIGFPSTPDCDVEKYFALMRELAAEFPAAIDHIMYGSDWHMIAQTSGNGQYFTTAFERFASHWPEAQSGVFNATARRWLDLDDSQSPARRRLDTFNSGHPITTPSA